MAIFGENQPFYGLEKGPKNPQKSRAGLGFSPPPGGAPPGGGKQQIVAKKRSPATKRPTKYQKKAKLEDIVKVGIHSLASPIR